MSVSVIDVSIAAQDRARKPSASNPTKLIGSPFACQYTSIEGNDVVVVFGRFDSDQHGEPVPAGRWLPGNFIVHAYKPGSAASSNHGCLELLRHSGKPCRRPLELSWLGLFQDGSEHHMHDLARGLAPAGQARVIATPQQVVGQHVEVRAGGETVALPISGLVITKSFCAYQFAPGLEFGQLKNAQPAALVRGWGEGQDKCRLIFYPGSQGGLDGSFRFV